MYFSFNKFFFLLALFTITIVFLALSEAKSSSSSRGSSSNGSRGSNSNGPRGSPSKMSIFKDFMSMFSKKKSSSNPNPNAPNGGTKSGTFTKTLKTVKKLGKMIHVNRPRAKTASPAPPLPASSEAVEEVYDDVNATYSFIQTNGTLLCNGQPAADILIKIKDTNPYILLNTTSTDESGYFELSAIGQDGNFHGLKLNIYHDCADFLPCQRKLTMWIPAGFVMELGSKTTLKVYTLGNLELSEKKGDEERDCFH